MGERLRQRIGTNGLTHKAGVWAGMVGIAIAVSVLGVAGVLHGNSALFNASDNAWIGIAFRLVKMMVVSLLLPYGLLVLQWSMDDKSVIRNAGTLKALAGVLMLLSLISPVSMLVSGLLFWTYDAHLLLSAGLALFKFVSLHEAADRDGPADWAIAAARRIAEKD